MNATGKPNWTWSETSQAGSHGVVTFRVRERLQCGVAYITPQTPAIRYQSLYAPMNAMAILEEQCPYSVMHTAKGN